MKGGVKVQSEKLKKLGFNDSIRGARYMDSALKIIGNDKARYMDSALKIIGNDNNIHIGELCEKLAEEFDTKPDNINSGIRYAIRKWWDNVSPDVKEKYFAYNCNTGNPPTNKVFLTIVSSEKM